MSTTQVSVGKSDPDVPTTSISVGKHGNVCVVDPSPANAGPGHTVKWTNNTGDEIEIFFPNHGRVFVDFPRDSSGNPHKKVPGGQRNNQYSASVHPKAGANNPNGKHHYAIYCKATGSFAVGGSDPELDVQ